MNARRKLRPPYAALLWAAALALAAPVRAQPVENGLLKVGGFRCVGLTPLRNDSALDLYDIGYWTNAGFRMEVWKRNGVPFWYPQGSGDVRVAGAAWKPVGQDLVSSRQQGGVAGADSQAPGNGAIAWANDDDPTTYWYAGDGHPSGKLSIAFAHPARVRLIRFLSWKTGRHAPRDYSVGLILPDGSRSEVAAVHDEKRLGQWIEFALEPTEAVGIYLDVARTIEGEHGPVIYEFQARGEPVAREGQPAYPSEVVVPLGGTPAQELFCLGHVGNGFDPAPDVLTPVGEYVLRYDGGETETVPLVAGRNVADLRFGSFVPEAEFAFGLRDAYAEGAAAPGARFYHLDDMLPVEPKSQVLMFGHKLAHPGKPLVSLTFRCTDPKASLVLVAVTLRQSGPRINALVYDGRRITPYPKGTPKAPPSPLDRLEDKTRVLSLDGEWRYVTDPGNQGLRRRYFAPEHDVSNWQRMPVPSQWYVQGLDYHGVVWFRRQFDLPASFAGLSARASLRRRGLRRAGLGEREVRRAARRGLLGLLVGRHSSPPEGRAEHDRGSRGQPRRSRPSGAQDPDQGQQYGRHLHALRPGGLPGRHLPARRGSREGRHRHRGCLDREHGRRGSFARPRDGAVHPRVADRAAAGGDLDLSADRTRRRAGQATRLPCRAIRRGLRPHRRRPDPRPQAPEAVVPVGARAAGPASTRDRAATRPSAARPAGLASGRARGLLQREGELPLCQPPPDLHQGHAE